MLGPVGVERGALLRLHLDNVPRRVEAEADPRGAGGRGHPHLGDIARDKAPFEVRVAQDRVRRPGQFSQIAVSLAQRQRGARGPGHADGAQKPHLKPPLARDIGIQNAQLRERPPVLSRQPDETRRAERDRLPGGDLCEGAALFRAQLSRLGQAGDAQLRTAFGPATHGEFQHRLRQPGDLARQSAFMQLRHQPHPALAKRAGHRHLHGKGDNQDQKDESDEYLHRVLCLQGFAPLTPILRDLWRNSSQGCTIRRRTAYFRTICETLSAPA